MSGAGRQHPTGHSQPEHLLSQALRAQAAGMPARTASRPAPSSSVPLSVGWLLLIAVALGLLAGAVAGLITVL